MKGACMATLTSISDGNLSATIDAQGAQLMSLVREGGEYLWQGDERYWARRAPAAPPPRRATSPSSVTASRVSTSTPSLPRPRRA